MSEALEATIYIVSPVFMLAVVYAILGLVDFYND